MSLSALNISSQKFPITADILRQTFIIKTDTLQGTCFLIEVGNQEYLLTAKHLFKTKLQNGVTTNIQIYQENKNRNLKVQYLTHEDITCDIALLKLFDSVKVMKPFSIEGQVTLGQDVYFLGFPKFNNLDFYTSSNIGILPLVKSGIISGWINTGIYNLYFLDGHNNPGFSGGPALCIDKTTGAPVIFGVISGYFIENKQVNKIDTGHKSKVMISDSDYIQENSGIIKCYPAILAQQIINRAK